MQKVVLTGNRQVGGLSLEKRGALFIATSSNFTPAMIAFPRAIENKEMLTMHRPGSRIEVGGGGPSSDSIVLLSFRI